ncbi:hypothetical protein C8R45DRAFT_300445 [Mycena sanguinolenta]|nr:hypothetical protein C8R45DRAFT_300445 [Mycena sanguinolenta]
MALRYRSSMIPVFYSGLNPALIPTILTRFDLLGWPSVRSEIIQAHLCLRGVLDLASRNVIVPGAIVDIWRNVWPWVQFLDEYAESLSNDDFPDAETRYSEFLSLIRFFRANEAAGQLIDSPPGLYVVVGRAWRHLIRERNEEGLADASYFLGLNRDWNSPAFDELITGSGGTRSELASVVISHITYALPNPDCPVTHDTLSFLVGIFYIVASESVAGYQDLAFQGHLLSQGIVSTLTIAVRALCRSKLKVAGIMLQGFGSTLVTQISSFSPTWLPESLRAGLLDIFTPEHGEAVSPSLAMLLKDILPPATVYHSVLTALQTSLPQVRDRDVSVTSNDPALVAHWKSFVALVENRLPILNEYNTGALLAMRPCDNLECTKICPKRELQRCSGCSTMCYCSRICQRADWRSGHRLTCLRLGLNRKRFIHISPRNRSFLHALVYHEYITRHQEVARLQQLFMKENPGQLPCTIFDFAEGSCTIEVWPLAQFVAELELELDPERIAQSTGKLQLHLMRVVDADWTECLFWPFPLRLASTQLVEGREAIDTTLLDEHVEDGGNSNADAANIDILPLK